MAKRQSKGAMASQCFVAPAMIDALEPRLLFSGHQQIISMFYGTVNVRRRAGQGAVTITRGHVRNHSTITISFNGRSRTYTAANVDHLFVNGGNRDDLIRNDMIWISAPDMPGPAPKPTPDPLGPLGNGSRTFNLSGGTLSIDPLHFIPPDSSAGVYNLSGGNLGMSGGTVNVTPGGAGAILQGNPTLLPGSAIILPDGTIIPYTLGMTLPSPSTILSPSDPRAQAVNNPSSAQITIGTQPATTIGSQPNNLSGGTLNMGVLTLNPVNGSGITFNPGNPVLGVAPNVPIQPMTIPPVIPPDSSGAILTVATPNQL
jgi:hypothetical protein